MNIITVFAGRKPNLEVLTKYFKQALELGIIHEVHFWNNTRQTSDEDYLKQISNLRRTSSAAGGIYNLITPKIRNNSFNINVKATNDIHIKLVCGKIEYEIVLGGWNNRMSVIRENGKIICISKRKCLANGNNGVNFRIQIINDTLIIRRRKSIIMAKTIHRNFVIKKVFAKTGHEAIGEFNYETTINKGFYFMDTCEKSWKNYYQFYTDKKYQNDVIMKCDDDIVFIDLYKLPNFINFIRNNNHDLVFANTINNGVSAFFQQNKFELIPKTLMDLEYPPNGLCGSLWESGKKAESLHNYFINNYKNFIDHDYNNEIIPIETRFSINFFGYKGSNWHKIADCYKDDEYNLTVTFVKERGFKNVLYTDLYVSHLSFFKQNDTGMNSTDLINKYNNLYYNHYIQNRFTH